MALCRDADPDYCCLRATAHDLSPQEKFSLEQADDVAAGDDHVIHNADVHE